MGLRELKGLKELKELKGLRVEKLRELIRFASLCYRPDRRVRNAIK